MLWVVIRIASPTYVVGIHYNCLAEVILMITHDIIMFLWRNMEKNMENYP